MNKCNRENDEISKNATELLHKLFDSNSKVKPSGHSILGDLGLVIFSSVYNYYFKSEKSKLILQSHIQAFEIELDSYSNENPTLETLASGYLSFGMIYHFLRKYSNIHESSYFENSIDDIAFSALKFQLGLKNFDYLYGATGILHYILKHTKDTEKLKSSITIYINCLKKNMIKSKHGIMWEDYYFRQREKALGINLGLAHGIVGILKVLVLVSKSTDDNNIRQDVGKMIKGVCNFLINIASVNTDITYSYFYIPNNPKGDTKMDTRLGWCYGDLSNAFVLLQAGKEIQDLSIISFAKEVIGKTTKRKLPIKTNVQDAGLCHGASGIFHIYSLIYSNDNENGMNKISEYWLEETINESNKYLGQGIYKKFNPIEKAYEVEYGFLEGSSGVGLSLISYLTKDRYWDYLLLLND